MLVLKNLKSFKAKIKSIDDEFCTDVAAVAGVATSTAEVVRETEVREVKRNGGGMHKQKSWQEIETEKLLRESETQKRVSLHFCSSKKSCPKIEKEAE